MMNRKRSGAKNCIASHRLDGKANQLPKLLFGRLTTVPSRQPLLEWLDDLFIVNRREVERYLKLYPHQFAKLQGDWEAMKGRMKRGDILYLWSAGFEYSVHHLVSGYSIVREGKPIATLTLPKRTALDVITSLDRQPKKKYLTDRLIVEELEYLAKGGVGDQWRAMKRLMQPDDHLRRFHEYHGPLASRGGYCLLRDGKVIATIVTIMS